MFNSPSRSKHTSRRPTTCDSLMTGAYFYAATYKPTCASWGDAGSTGIAAPIFHAADGATICQPAGYTECKLTMSDRNRIARATERMTHYVSTYNQQPSFHDYTDKTFVFDMFYGVALSLGYEAGPDGFAKFKSDWKIGA